MFYLNISTRELGGEEEQVLFKVDGGLRVSFSIVTITSPVISVLAWLVPRLLEATQLYFPN